MIYMPELMLYLIFLFYHSFDKKSRHKKQKLSDLLSFCLEID